MKYYYLKEGACGDELSARSRAVLPAGADSALPGLRGAGSAQVPGRQEGDVGEAGRLLQPARQAEHRAVVQQAAAGGQTATFHSCPQIFVQNCPIIHLACLGDYLTRVKTREMRCGGRNAAMLA